MPNWHIYSITWVGLSLKRRTSPRRWQADIGDVSPKRPGDQVAIRFESQKLFRHCCRRDVL